MTSLNNDTITVKIRNFESYKGRKEVKNNVWFRCSNRLLEDHELFNFKPKEILTWIYLLSISSQKNTEIVHVSFKHAKNICRLPRKTVENAISKLCKINCLEVLSVQSSKRKQHKPVRHPRTTLHNTTEQDTTLHNTTVDERTAKPPATIENHLTKLIWESYRDAYKNRYGDEPVRNAKVNAQIKQLGNRLGAEAPEVVRFFVQHNKSFYVSKTHDIGLCVSDAEGLRTQWATGKTITERQARQADDGSALRNQLQRIREGSI